MSKYNSGWIERNVYYQIKPGSDPKDNHYVQYERPIIVCLCGSTRFKDAYFEANFNETQAGKIVLTVGWYSHTDQRHDLPPDAKVKADLLHFRKIELADEVLILNVGGYIGESTKNELEYARKLCKTIRFLEEPK